MLARLAALALAIWSRNASDVFLGVGSEPSLVGGVMLLRSELADDVLEG